jgi:hypothetical protein
MRTLLELTEDPNFLQYEGVNNLTGLAIAYLMHESGFKDITSKGYKVNKKAHLGELKTRIYDTMFAGAMEPFWRNIIEYIDDMKVENVPKGILNENTIEAITGISYSTLRQNPRLVDPDSHWIQVIESNWNGVPLHLFDAFGYAIVTEQDEQKKQEYLLQQIKVLSMLPNEFMLHHIQHGFRRIDASKLSDEGMKEAYKLASKYICNSC